MPFLKDRTKVKMSRSEYLEIITRKQGLRATIFNTNGDKYIGDWKDNVRTGKGRVLTKDWNQYECDLYKNMRHGFGILSNRISGTSVFTLEYRGGFKNGKPFGKGTRIYPDGTFYIGEFKKGKRHGYGQQWNADCSFYDGYWANDKTHGEGCFIFANGNRYEGEWKDGNKHGKGRYFHLDTGQMQEGVWYNDGCIYSSLSDIPYRQSAKIPSQYPINSVKLMNVDEMCALREEEALMGHGASCSALSIESNLTAT